MTRTLPSPITITDSLLVTVVGQLDEVAALLTEIRDRLPQTTPEPAGDVPGGPGTPDEREPVHVTEPAPVRAPRPPAKKTAAASKPGKE